MNLVLISTLAVCILIANSPPGIPGGGGGLGGKFSPATTDRPPVGQPNFDGVVQAAERLEKEVPPEKQQNDNDEKDLKTIVVVSTDDYNTLTQFQRSTSIKSDQVDAIRNIFSAKVAFESLRLETDSWNSEKRISRVELLDLIDRALIKSKKSVSEKEIAQRVKDNQLAAVENDRVDSVIKKLETEIAALKRRIESLRKN